MRFAAPAALSFARTCRIGPGSRPPAARSGPPVSAADRAGQLRLVHRRTALHATAPCLRVELGLGRAAGTAMRALPTAACGGDVLRGGPAGGLGLARASPLLVDRARRDLFGPAGALTTLLGALLDVLVLPLTFGTRSLWNESPPPGCRDRRPRAGPWAGPLPWRPPSNPVACREPHGAAGQCLR
jgi:hypothetical protein